MPPTGETRRWWPCQQCKGEWFATKPPKQCPACRCREMDGGLYLKTAWGSEIVSKPVRGKKRLRGEAPLLGHEEVGQLLGLEGPPEGRRSPQTRPKPGVKGEGRPRGNGRGREAAQVPVKQRKKGPTGQPRRPGRSPSAPAVKSAPSSRRPAQAGGTRKPTASGSGKTRAGGRPRSPRSS